MSLIKKLSDFLKKLKIEGTFFDSTTYELENFIKGIGDAIIEESTITIEDYPFEPSFAFPNKTLNKSDIDAICVDAYPPFLRIGNEVVFISRVKYKELENFAIRNRIERFEETNNWTWILEPYVDTEFTKDTERRILKLLLNNGFTVSEVEEIRKEVGTQMMKYNYDTMLWDWGELGLSDVLEAMKVKYNKAEFRNFFQRAMEIELRSRFSSS